ncbi:MAG: hypothetical protein KDD60_10970, partial [Bdellovibrionales bacterium]|nr:hypothetical protein [Bdellovibrionales bacterium]
MGNKQNNIHKKKKRKYHSRSQKTGLPPGTLVYVGTARDERASLEIAQYTRDSFETNQMDTFEKCLPYFSEANRDESSQITTWLNVIGLHDTNLIQQIGTHFAIHPLVLEDIVNTGQRPKGEEFEGYFFLTSRMAYLASDTKEPTIEQVSFLLFSNMLITFQEQSQDVFEPIRERLQQGKGKIRSSGADFLFYSMLDALVDNYFDVLDVTGGELEEMEDHLL